MACMWPEVFIVHAYLKKSAFGDKDVRTETPVLVSCKSLCKSLVKNVSKSERYTGKKHDDLRQIHQLRKRSNILFIN